MVQNSVIKCLVKDVPQELDKICLILLIMTRISFIITLSSFENDIHRKYEPLHEVLY